MVRKLLHIALLIHLVSFGMAQSAPPWIISNGESSKFITVFSDSIFTDNSTSSTNDYIGAFTENSKGSFCIGFSKLDSGLVTIETLFSNDSSSFGGHVGNEITIKHWNSENECVFSTTTPSLVLGNTTLTYDRDTLVLSQINSFSSEIPVEYESVYVNTGEIITPTIISIDSLNTDYTFTSPTLILDSITGTIDLSISSDNTHEIKIVSNSCLTSNVLSVQIIPYIPQYDFLPWIISYNLTPQIIEVNSDSIFTDDLKASSSDYIGAFVTNEQGTFCIGIAKIDSLQTEILTTFSSDNYSSGAHLGDEIELKHWSSINECTYPITSWEDSLFISNDTLKVNKLNSYSVLPTIAYDSVYINTGDLISPETIISSSDTFDYSFSSSTLEVDSLTGIVDLSFASNDEHEISISSETCFSVLNFSFYITEKSITPPITIPEEIPTKLSDSNNYISNLNDNYRTLTIESNGFNIEIYDRTGRLVISSNKTFEWDGRDQYGKLLPADDYYVKIGDNFTIVTVLN